MSLELTVTDVILRLRQGLFPNEQSISQGIVLRILQQLGWESWDTTVVWPEYQTGEGRADFALCQPPTKPAIFIEVKPPGRAEEGVRQALDYAFHSGGVPFVVLTDGKTWSFYPCFSSDRIGTASCGGRAISSGIFTQWHSHAPRKDVPLYQRH